ncbi:MAG TPA: DUF1015 domain-containing protein [Candidatus Polarisedimenticolia bacterium]|nr:DUF1015 domain-containing protein [Candidatus Polarisedimenticolia bacterium]
MARVVPFPALRFASRLAAEMDRLAAPPYDVISETDRASYEALHPKNIVRLILPGEAGRTEDGSFYSGAAALLRQWRTEGTLVQDPAPAFYPYRQTFRGPDGSVASRTGFLGALELPAPEARGASVLPHEKTLEAPRRDRTRLIAACRANLSPIFLLHPDSRGEAGACLEEATTPGPLISFTDRGEVRHELWVVPEGPLTGRLSRALDSEWTLIADGHHRYESAVAVRDSLPDEKGAGFVLAFFCSLKDRGFRIFPIHRLLKAAPAGIGAEPLQQILGRRHPVEIPPDSAGPRELREALGAAGERSFGVVPRGGAPFLLKVKPQAEAEDGSAGDLDTVVLERQVLSAALGVSPADIAAGALGFTPDAAEAFRQVRSGEAWAAFLLNPLRTEAVVRAAQSGIRLPQKSTYFYPKVFTGLVIRPF